MGYKLCFLEVLGCLTSILVPTFSCFIIFNFTSITHIQYVTKNFITPHLTIYVINIHVIDSILQFFTTSLQYMKSICF